MTLAKQIKQVMYLDAKRTQGEWQNCGEDIEHFYNDIHGYSRSYTAGYDPLVMAVLPATTPLEKRFWNDESNDAFELNLISRDKDGLHCNFNKSDYAFIAQAPLMASIIRQLTDIVKHQHEALDESKILIGAKNDRLNAAQIESNINRAWHIMNTALALSAPIVKEIV